MWLLRRKLLERRKNKRNKIKSITSIINNLNDTDVRGIWMVAQALYAKQELEKQKEKEKEKQ